MKGMTTIRLDSRTADMGPSFRYDLDGLGLGLGVLSGPECLGFLFFANMSRVQLLESGFALGKTRGSAASLVA